jgi:hypothetical protein
MVEILQAAKARALRMTTSSPGNTTIDFFLTPV